KPKPKPKAALTAARELVPRGRATTPMCLKEAQLSLLSAVDGKALVGFSAKAARPAATGAPRNKKTQAPAFAADVHTTAVEDLRTHRRVPLEKYEELYTIAPSFAEQARFVTAVTGSGLGLNNTFAVWDARNGKLVHQSSLTMTAANG